MHEFRFQHLHDPQPPILILFRQKAYETESLYHKIRLFTTYDAEKQILVASDSSYSVMPWLQLIVPDHYFCILKTAADNDFSPFVFQKIEIFLE